MTLTTDCYCWLLPRYATTELFAFILLMCTQYVYFSLCISFLMVYYVNCPYFLRLLQWESLTLTTDCYCQGMRALLQWEFVTIASDGYFYYTLALLQWGSMTFTTNYYGCSLPVYSTTLTVGVCVIATDGYYWSLQGYGITLTVGVYGHYNRLLLLVTAKV